MNISMMPKTIYKKIKHKWNNFKKDYKLKNMSDEQLVSTLKGLYKGNERLIYIKGYLFYDLDIEMQKRAKKKGWHNLTNDEKSMVVLSAQHRSFYHKIHNLDVEDISAPLPSKLKKLLTRLRPSSRKPS